MKKRLVISTHKKDRHPPKVVFQRRHAKTRAAQRYDVDLTRDVQDRIVNAIQSNDPTLARHLEKQTNRISVWLINYGGKLIPVVYDKERKSVVTVLPPSYLEELERHKELS